MPESVAEAEPEVAVEPRIQRALGWLDLTRGRGLEIGPLARPIVRRGEADVYYVDVLDTAGLKAHYGGDPNVPPEDVVDVDFAMLQDGTMRSLSTAARPAAPYQWMVASHVVEHVPDLVTFLREIAELLDEGGRLSLIVPDRRFCFDALRPTTTVGDILRAHYAGDTRPSVRAVFDHFANVVHYSPVDLWAGKPATADQRMYTLEQARQQVDLWLTSDEYIDTHTWLFTPASFCEQLQTLARLGLIDFTVAGLSPTQLNDIEFFVTLQKLPIGLADDVREQRIERGFPDGSAEWDAAVAELPGLDQPEAIGATVEAPVVVHPNVVPEATGPTSGADDAVVLTVSRKEQRVIEGKRRLVHAARRGLARVRTPKG